MWNGAQHVSIPWNVGCSKFPRGARTFRVVNTDEKAPHIIEREREKDERAREGEGGREGESEKDLKRDGTPMYEMPVGKI